MAAAVLHDVGAAARSRVGAWVPVRRQPLAAGIVTVRTAAASVLASGVIVLLLTVVAGSPVRAETLKDALTSAYENNPRILAERATLKAADEEVARANSGWRPNLSVSGDYGYTHKSTSPGQSGDGSARPYGYSVNATQPVFSGFRTRNAVREAEANVLAAREDLRGIEAAVLLEAATAYADVFRDHQVVRLRRHNVQVLAKELRSAQRRLAQSEATRTEVAQSRARRARAVAALASAQAQLQTSLAEFKRVVGRGAGRLAAPRLPARLPRTLPLALQIGDDQSPGLLAAVHRNIAADYSRAKIRGELLPSVSIEASHTGRYNSSSVTNRSGNTTVLGRLNVPLYQGGEVWARLRQASHRRDKTRHDVQQAKLSVEATIKAAWSQLRAARAQRSAIAEQVSANKIALRGSRAEYSQGQIRLIEVLDAQQELNESQVNLAQAQRDVIEASFALLGSMGTLQADNLKLAAAIYEPENHLEAVRHKWFGITVHYADGHSERMYVTPPKRR